ncbi:MAG TPA: nucleotidyltransferase family protein [Bacillota bacterium]|nr:nucleotidyltransferase family protein [Bacillota bacterium]
MIDAVVLAGSPNDGPLQECSPVLHEALIPIGGRAMVEYVVDALLNSRQIRRVLVVGPEAELSSMLSGDRVSVAGSAGGIMQNIEAGLSRLPGAKRVLLATSDIPMLTSEAVDDFLTLCGDMSGDLYYPVISRNEVEKKFPSTRRTYVSLRSGVYTGGNLFIINPAKFKMCVDNGQKLISLRKSPVGLCRLLGVVFVVKFLTRTLTLHEAEKKVSELLGIKGTVVISRFPEIGVDVDKPDDLELVLKTMGFN